ncbi:P-loop containing nucleoside triphosphate hydrolase protein [Gloeophyllum trabeum ATCC 11539]|uniref:RNA helicase n=1 Tax=Gloeophyllum trabeum (strain ATCC 11539 / FP-39264 / Madison 617) TaxID=670483 RepID=S7QLI4_GLOTA|nr:P-loop containing nucleoside triphosphate hydrolase protein [Gloeophyllum trabeum ATCC 11539]EPQ60243.1 P-loop containing nucleoside triphosphate hydrolase protein [Gloeophyllum trabeum ATCC 11539]
MPPRRGIVKSGNAGNSSKPKNTSGEAQPATEGVKALFPPGYKYPLSLLSERCQKNGWEKPIVDTPRRADKYHFIVTLSRLNKKTSQTESVRMEPHPPKLMPTALEARHWGATYALYRFCNNIQLNMQLPPGPRDYWNELAAEHKTAPDHQKWMYDPDPFAAKKAVEERQAQAAQRKEQKSQSVSEERRGGQVSPEFASAPEVKMAGSLREQVETCIKRAFTEYPEVEEPAILPEDEKGALQQQLSRLGFSASQCRNAISFLSTPSPSASALLRTSTYLEAAIEYLVLNVPECDLPARFLPENNSSNSFVRAAHSGTDDLKRRWMEDKAVKEAGWPAKAVKDCMASSESPPDWEELIRRLNQRLTGDFWDSTVPNAENSRPVDLEELDSIDARYVNDSEIVISLFTSPLKLHAIHSRGAPYPTSASPPPMYITCSTVAAYIRLHLLAELLRVFRSDTLIQPGEGFFTATLRFLEEGWASIEDHGPPDMSSVLRHLLFQSPPLIQQSSDHHVDEGGKAESARTPRHKRAAGRRDTRTNSQIKEEYEALRRTDKYSTVQASRSKLPAFKSQDEFVRLVQANRVVVVVGETGSGKTTQLPQFILDSLILGDRGASASILVTQPRRISAISVAARVSAERLDDGSVGYAIRGESKQSARTKILFCTTGVVLRRLSGGDNLQGVSHIIVDEVHERSVDGDFLLLELKEILESNPNLKVILMSATINHETFVRYFNGAPLLSIPGFTHPVTDLYLEDIVPRVDYRPTPPKLGKKEKEDARRPFQEKLRAQDLDDQSVAAIDSISRSGRIDYQLIAHTVKHIMATASKRAGMLIFLPGVQEIRQCMEAVGSVATRVDADILPLHANLSSEEQRRVFLPTSKWKIVVATNVAETSITIDDIVYVIDAGKVKETEYDHDSGLTKLVEKWVTRAAARQRRGRAGRTQPGFCYKLYTRDHERTLLEFPVPEILRVPLEQLCLTVKAMREEEDVKRFLTRAIDPPAIAALDNAWSVLEDLEAIDENGRLTALGRHMSMLPVDLRLAKMLILGTIFQCLGPVLDVAACLSCKPLFLNPMDKREEATQARIRFATGNSDLLTDVHAYNECARLRSEGKSAGAIKAFCDENFISPATIREITTLRQDFLSALSEIGFIPFRATPSDAQLNTHSSNENLVKACILGGLWPRVARVHLPRSAIKFDRVQAGTVQRENVAKEYKMYDLREGRVFLHPGSVLFGATAWRSPFLAYFQKSMTTKMFLRDATEVPLYALLLFGGRLSVNHVGGGLTIASKDAFIKLRAWPRIGVLVNQLRRLLDAQLQRCMEEGTTLSSKRDSPIIQAISALLAGDGLTNNL